MEEQIKKWKELYTYVYKMNISNKDYYFRSLSRSDYFDILNKQAEENFDNDLEVVKRCVISEVDEKEFENKAGLATVLSEKIMSISGFETSEPELL